MLQTQPLIDKIKDDQSTVKIMFNVGFQSNIKIDLFFSF